MAGPSTERPVWKESRPGGGTAVGTWYASRDISVVSRCAEPLCGFVREWLELEERVEGCPTFMTISGGGKRRQNIWPCLFWKHQNSPPERWKWIMSCQTSLFSIISSRYCIYFVINDPFYQPIFLKVFLPTRSISQATTQINAWPKFKEGPQFPSTLRQSWKNSNECLDYWVCDFLIWAR